MRTILLNLLKRPRSAAVTPPPQDPAHFFNRKVTDPSRLMHPADGNRYHCPWLNHGITVHSDGNVTCGLDDPYGRRSFGNINRQTVAEIWANPEYERLQRKLWEGHRCTECGLAQRVEDGVTETMPARSQRPTTLVVETTVRCNLRCPQPACIPNNDRAIRTRDSDFLGLDTLRRVADELAGNLGYVYFYNYGDPFVNARAEDMLAHLNQTSPDARVTTSTNGIPLAKLERARKVVASGGLDHIVFTIGGVTQESYSRYHVGGRVDLALRGMNNVLQAKRELGRSKPVVHWRYLVFRWNDSESEIESALRLAEQYGVDEFSLYLTHVPAGALSFRFSPGSPNFARYRKHIENSHGYTLESPMPDENGFFGVEQLALGAARWTGWQARKRLRVDHNRARLAVSTNRPESGERTNHVFVVTPWQKVKVPLQPGAWRSIELTTPDHLQLDTLDVETVTFDHWFPAEECGSTDQRCLGVLVQEDGAEDTPPWRGFVPLGPTDAARLAEFRYQAPRQLIDWLNGGADPDAAAIVAAIEQPTLRPGA
jgi:MoaA/NifB/PqqE/SkfB family radical SAM enzyme